VNILKLLNKKRGSGRAQKEGIHYKTALAVLFSRCFSQQKIEFK